MLYRVDFNAGQEVPTMNPVFTNVVKDNPLLVT